MKLKKAQKKFKKGNYTFVINSLESQIFIYRDNSSYFYILGMSSLFLNDIGGAYTYLSSAYKLNNTNIYIKLAYAAVLLKKGNIENSLKTYLEVLANNPKDKYAKKGLALIKGFEKPEANAIDLNIKTLYSLIPEKKRKPTTSKITMFFSVTTFILLSIAIGASLGGYKHKQNMKITDRGLPFDASTISSFISFKEITKFNFTEEQIKYHYNLALRYFDKRRDNLARVEFNRLRLSNASEEIKNRIKTMDSMLESPDFSNFKDNHEYSVIKNNFNNDSPLLYDRIFVSWKGRISDLEIQSDRINFNFLVGYHDKKIVEAIVPAEAAFAQTIDNRIAYEILAQVIITEDEKVFLKVKAFKRLDEY